VNSSEAIFDFQPQYEFEKLENVNYVEEFESFERLLEKIQNQNNLVLFESSFFDTTLEKVYFNTIRENNYDINLIQDWQKSYSLN
jgi:ribosome assembly protein YihI (activator of Der GTPase)